MTSDIAAAANTDADIRWQHWQAQGRALDRRRAVITSRMIVLVIAAWAVWLLVELV
jgi:hypothetical protein